MQAGGRRFDPGWLHSRKYLVIGSFWRRAAPKARRTLRLGRTIGPHLRPRLAVPPSFGPRLAATGHGLPDRTQEVAGSSPASSIGGSAANFDLSALAVSVGRPGRAIGHQLWSSNRARNRRPAVLLPGRERAACRPCPAAVACGPDRRQRAFGSEHLINENPAGCGVLEFGALDHRRASGPDRWHGGVV